MTKDQNRSWLWLLLLLLLLWLWRRQAQHKPAAAAPAPVVHPAPAPVEGPDMASTGTSVLDPPETTGTSYYTMQAVSDPALLLPGTGVAIVTDSSVNLLNSAVEQMLNEHVPSQRVYDWEPQGLIRYYNYRKESGWPTDVVLQEINDALAFWAKTNGL